MIIKFSNVALGVSVPPLEDDVTDVVPSEVTLPVTVCVRLTLSAPEVVDGTSMECVWLDDVAVDPLVPCGTRLVLAVAEVNAAGFVA